jgi:hypothetical protein
MLFALFRGIGQTFEGSSTKTPPLLREPMNREVFDIGTVHASAEPCLLGLGSDVSVFILFRLRRCCWRPRRAASVLLPLPARGCVGADFLALRVSLSYISRG